MTQTEAIAIVAERLMGCFLNGDGYWELVDSGPFNPFLSAEDDYAVLRTVNQKFDTVQKRDFRSHLSADPLDYALGYYCMAAAEVLRGEQ